jgi:hypothetical protein
MHITCSDPSERRKFVKDEKKGSELQELARAAVTGHCITHTALKNKIAEIKNVTDRPAKNRIKEMLDRGILSKREDGLYELSK